MPRLPGLLVRPCPMECLDVIPYSRVSPWIRLALGAPRKHTTLPWASGQACGRPSLCAAPNEVIGRFDNYARPGSDHSRYLNTGTDTASARSQMPAPTSGYLVHGFSGTPWLTCRAKSPAMFPSSPNRSGDSARRPYRGLRRPRRRRHLASPRSFLQGRHPRHLPPLRRRLLHRHPTRLRRPPSSHRPHRWTERFDDQEVTSCVLWLRSFGLDISCVEITPYPSSIDLKNQHPLH